MFLYFPVFSLQYQISPVDQYVTERIKMKFQLARNRPFIKAILNKYFTLKSDSFARQKCSNFCININHCRTHQRLMNKSVPIVHAWCYSNYYFVHFFTNRTQASENREVHLTASNNCNRFSCDRLIQFVCNEYVLFFVGWWSSMNGYGMSRIVTRKKLIVVQQSYEIDRPRDS